MSLIPKITELNSVEVSRQIFDQLHQADPESHDHMLPLLFNLNGQPYTLQNHFQMKPLFAKILPPEMTFKTGRQVCVAAGTLIFFADGRQIPIETVVKEKVQGQVLAYNTDANTFTPSRILNYWETGVKECVKITTKSGRTITSTLDHKYLTPDGWKRLRDIPVKGYIAVPKRLNHFGETDVTEDVAAFIAYLTADGSLTTGGIVWNKCDQRLVNDFSDVCAKLGCGLKPERPISEGKYRVTGSYHKGKKSLGRQLCEQFGIYNTKSTQKTVSSLILTAPKPILARYLQVLFSSDGWCSKHGNNNRRMIGYSTSSQILANQIQSLLSRFGIISKLSHSKVRCNGKEFDAWKVSILAEEHVTLFLTEIGWLRDIPEKPSHGQTKSFLDPIPANIGLRIYQELKEVITTRTLWKSYGGIQKQSKSGRPLMRQKLLNVPYHPLLDKYLNSHIAWDEITSIVSAGNVQTYDLEVETYHNYVANNIVTHNSKTTSNGAQSIIYARINNHHNVLHVAPLHVHIERFSTDHVAPLIADSPVKSFLVDKHCKKAMLQRSLKNGSNLIFTFAFHDCTRTRGVSANLLKYDEYQDLDPSFEPIINQTLSAGHMKSLSVNPEKASEAGLMRFGTPLTLENGLEQAWSRSSQAEWCIICQKCKHDNVPSKDQDLDKMMGPFTRKELVTPETPGIVCAKCGHFLFTREGRWVHAFPERRHLHAGYHIPQCIMSFHCESQAAWNRLQTVRLNQNAEAVAKFYNEICGESYDHGQKLISVTDLRNAAVLSPRTQTDEHVKAITSGRYVDWGVGVDWGGGGKSGISRTAFAVAGLRVDGVVEVFTGFRSPTPNDFNLEANRTIDIANTFQCKFLASDFNGTGNRLRIAKLIDHGYPQRLIYPIAYTGVPDLAKIVPATDDTPDHIQTNKARSFLYLAQLIRALRVRFFAYDFYSTEDPGLLHDFTSLAEERIEMKSVGEVHRVIHVETAGPDDFAHATNYAVMALFIRRGAFPDAGSIMTIADLTPEQQKAIEPALKDKDFDWFRKG